MNQMRRTMMVKGCRKIGNDLRHGGVWCLLAAVFLSGCRMIDSTYRSEVKEMNTVAKMEAWDAQGETESDLANQTEFTISLASAKLANSPKENVLLSPISARFAFATLLEGASGATAEELKQFLQISDVEDFNYKNKLTKQFLNTVLQKDQEPEKLTVKDSVWLDDQLDVKKDFLQRVGEEHFASVFQGDQGSEETAGEMNRWVKEATKGLIDPNIAEDSDRVMMIMNAFYMKLGWVSPFEEKMDKTGDFQTANGAVQVQFMNRRAEGDYYIETDRYRIAALPMEGGASYRVLLPKEGVTLDELLQEGERDTILRTLLTADLDTYADIEWSLPQHTMEQKSDLKDLLQSMGYNNMFSAQADFSKISTTPLYVDTARQLTKLIVDHQGVEAAAYTEIGMLKSAAPPEEVPLIEMKLDKPYLFAIEGPAELPLFIGAVENPAAPNR